MPTTSRIGPGLPARNPSGHRPAIDTPTMDPPCTRSFLPEALMAASSPARADLVDIRWSGDGRVIHSGTVATGQFVERCSERPSALQVRWHFDTGSAVDFDGHYRLGTQEAQPLQAQCRGECPRYAGRQDRTGLLLNMRQQACRVHHADCDPARLNGEAAPSLIGRKCASEQTDCMRKWTVASCEA